ncbi:MAG: hypothetical protein RLZZ422_2659 [Pseudomonadota bacterium]|jgi:serine protease
MLSRFWMALPLALSCSISTTTFALSNNTTSEPLISQLIIKLKPTSTGIRPAMTSNTMSLLAANTASNLTYKRPLSGDAHVLYLPYPMTREQAELYVSTVRQQTNIEYAEPDYVRYLATTPNDEYFSTQQWNLQSPATYAGAINALQAWDETTGSSEVTIAVVDAGINIAHSDLTGRGVPELTYGGYDMVINTSNVNSGDGDNRDANPNETEASWHGTHVAGIIGASANNSTGITGIDWQAKLLFVRVFGSGSTANLSDIVDGIRWAAGDPKISAGTGASGYLPVNPRPAKIINLSLGGYGSCTQTEQSAIDYAYNKGASIIAAAGNGCTMVGTCKPQSTEVETGINLDKEPHSPANCNNVITVAAVGANGQKASFSNYGSAITIAAPGVNIVTKAQGIYSTTGSGNSYGFIAGTSQAAPHVSGVIGLMLAAKSTLTPAQIKTALQASARPYTYNDNYKAGMGAGLLDACRAVRYVKGLSMGYCDKAATGSLVTISPITDYIKPTDPESKGGVTGGGGGSTNSLLLVIIGLLGLGRMMRR